MKMETIQIRATNGKGHDSSFPGVKIKKYVLSPASTLLGCFHDLIPSVENLREFKFKMVAARSNLNFQISDVYCIATYSYDVIASTLNRDLNEVNFETEQQLEELPNRIFGTFLLFSSAITDNNVAEAVNEFFDNLLPLNRKMVGCPVMVVSTPFQNLFLFNAQSNGIVCNVLGKNDCLFFTDVKLSRGCEGAPIFSTYGDLIGTVIYILAWCKGEWMGFTLAVHLYPVLKSWVKTLDEKSAVRLTKPQLPLDRYCFIENIDSYGVVMVSGPGTWGTGVILDKTSGLIVTCSHVVSYSRHTKISVEYKRDTFNAEVIYATTKDSPFDLAVVKTSLSHCEDIVEFKTPTSAVTKGEPIYIVGYPLFSLKNRTIQGPSVTYGHVANIYDDVMILATCASNSGSSGGALIRGNGELLGVISNNLMVFDALVPHLTIVIPSSIFLQPIRQFNETKDINVLNCFTSTDERIRRIWRLEIKCKL